MSPNSKIIVALSGGVDSSVAAHLLKEHGYDCVGVFMTMAPAPGSTGPAACDQSRCAKPQADDARRIAARLGIPLHVLDFRAEFERIIEYFIDEYARARTPNPCVVCNAQLKFGRLLSYAAGIGAAFVATGHHARVLHTDGPARLARSRNAAKDQSYALFGVKRENLSRCLFPLGEIADKKDIRQIAAGLGLDVHDKPESQEICFVPNDDYKTFVRARRPETACPGEVRDARGNLLGTHDGIVNYTIGQRRGLGIAAGQPIYVTGLDAKTNTVIVGLREELLSAGLIADRLNWLTDPPPVGEWCPAEIQIRYNHTATPGRIRVLADERVEARFDVPQAAVTPGQAAVFYDGDVVLGGGWIQAAVGE